MQSVKRISFITLLAGALAGCAGNNVDTAWQLMQQQQQEQAMMQQKSEEAERKRVAATRPAIALSMIKDAQQNGRYFASLAYLDAYRQTYGETPDVQILRADALRMTGQGDAAQQLYSKLTSGDQAAAAWHGLGLVAAGRGDFNGASDALGRAARLRPTDAQYLGDLGYALVRAGDFSAARVPLGQAAELDPGNARILGNLALLLVLQGDDNGAQQVMARGQLTPEAQARVYQLAGEIRRTTAAAEPAATVDVQAEAAPLASEVRVEAAPAASTAARPVVRDMNAPAQTAPRIASAQAPATQAVAAAAPDTAAAMPITQRPLLERMSNPPLVQ